MKPAYSNKQIEVANLLQSITTKGVPASTIDEIMNMLEDQTSTTMLPPMEPQETETTIKMKIMDEKDWKKRVRLCAMIISNSLE
jgi:DNA-binding transcriptional MerR regulator